MVRRGRGVDVMVKLKQIYVEWLDHHEATEETTATEKDELEPVTVHTCGFLISENATMIEVARDAYEGRFSPPLRIMKNCIVKRK